MTLAERNNKLKHFITCLKCKIKGHVCDDNCPTQYDAGNMGEIIENLEAISKALESCDNAVSRQDVHDMLENLPITVEDKWFNWLQKACIRLAELPSVTPQEQRCKECKWWKDSDGLYRRGGYAESQCPINRREVFEGNGYCYMFKPPQESEGA